MHPSLIEIGFKLRHVSKLVNFNEFRRPHTAPENEISHAENSRCVPAL